MNYRLLAAAVILGLYLALAIAILLQAARWEGSAWDHAMAIFASFGAIATAAASVLLGVEVQQANVEGARKEAGAATAQFAALAERHRIALAALSAPAEGEADEGRLARVRDLLSAVDARPMTDAT